MISMNGWMKEDRGQMSEIEGRERMDEEKCWNAWHTGI
jgi:hypothetical protein